MRGGLPRIAARPATPTAVTLGYTEYGRIRAKQREPMIMQSEKSIDDLDDHTKVSYNSGHNEY